jgi:hypothetical protein
MTPLSGDAHASTGDCSPADCLIGSEVGTPARAGRTAGVLDAGAKAIKLAAIASNTTQRAAPRMTRCAAPNLDLNVVLFGSMFMLFLSTECFVANSITE